MMKILFVDDDRKILDGLQRMLRPMRGEWEMKFTESGQEALQLLEQSNFEVIVSDMRMPGMTGAQLFDEVSKRYPHVVRIILSGQSDKEAILQSVGTTHLYLSKPCDADLLKETIARTYALRSLLGSESLKSLISQIKSIPCLPSVYVELMDELKSEEASIQKIGQIISRDVGMCAKILQLANSSFFGSKKYLATPAQAVVYLGYEFIRALVLSVHVFSQFEASALKTFSVERIWEHSLKTSAFAKQIAKLAKADQKTVDCSFMAGLLHDIGKVLLALSLPHRYLEVLALQEARKWTAWEAENSLLGASHGEVGAYLLGLWGLPDPVVEAVAYHHNPGRCVNQKFSPLTAVHLADFLASDASAETAGGPGKYLVSEYLSRIEIINQVELWEGASMKLQDQGAP